MEKTKINKIRDEKGGVTVNTSEIQCNIGEYFETRKSTRNKFTFKFTYKLLKLTQGDFNHLNRSIMNNEIE
jgi:hypothetical protein